MSIQQNLLLSKIKSVLGDKVYYKTDYRPNWMRNPKTNFNLEIDIFIPEILLGFEYQGYHHFKQGNKADKTRFKDSIKNKLAKRKHYTCSIVEIFESDIYGKDFKQILIGRVKQQAHLKTYNKFSVLIQQKDFYDVSVYQYENELLQFTQECMDVDLKDYAY